MMIDLYLLTGFSGSEKINFLKEVLKTSGDRKVGIIMNEFGKVGTDGGLLKDSSSELIEINKDSIFCSSPKLSFAESLKDMSKRPIDALFVDSYELVDPSNIGEIIEYTGTLIGKRYNYAGAICIINSLSFLDHQKDIETVSRHIRHSHLAVISKVGLLKDNSASEIERVVYSYNPDIEIVYSSMGRLPFSFFTDWKKSNFKSVHNDRTNNWNRKPKTLTLKIYGPVDKTKLNTFLEKISLEAYRWYGFVDLIDEGKQQVNIVNGKIDYSEDFDDNESKIVIVPKVGPSIIRSIISLWESEVNVKYKVKKWK